MAQRSWELMNKVEAVDSIYSYDEQQQQAIRSAKPWEKECEFVLVLSSFFFEEHFAVSFIYAMRECCDFMPVNCYFFAHITLKVLHLRTLSN